MALGPGHRRNRRGGEPRTGGRPCARWARSLARSPAGGLCVGSDGGRQRPLISANSNHRPIGGLVAVCDNVDVATLRYSTTTELRVDVIASTDGLDDRRFIIDVPAHGAPIYTAETTTQAADDDAAGCVGVARHRLGSALRACRARRVSRAARRWRQAHRGVTGERRPRATDDQRRRRRTRPQPRPDRRAAGPVC